MGSVFPTTDPTAWILKHRPTRAGADPFKPNGYFLEQERAASGHLVSCAGVLLTNKECPWRCLMCDLWRHTLENTAPRGAIPQQIRFALERLPAVSTHIKLYNSGSFFDVAAIPPDDYGPIADAVARFEHVVVESHPKLVGARALRFRDLLAGSLEVAMGLETVHPQVMASLNKRSDLKDFEQAVDLLVREGISVRAFVLIGLPFLSEGESLEWALKSVKFARDCGVTVVSLIPTRMGNGAMEKLRSAGEFQSPTLEMLEHALEEALTAMAGSAMGFRVLADTWNLDEFASCAKCFADRRERLMKMNLDQRVLPGVPCDYCSVR